MDVLSNPGSLVTEHETGEPSQQYDPLIFQQAVLVPPSYFKATVTSAQAERERTAAAAASPASTFVLSPRDNTRLLHHKKEEEEEEIAALRLQNQALRSQLQAVHHAPGSACPALHPHNLSYPTPAVLTSDLLQVECELHSRLGRTEAESRRCAGQLAALECTLREERHAHSRDKEALICQHHAALEQVMSEKREMEERWRREGEEWRERVGRVEEREREREEEVKGTQEKLAHMEQENSDLLGELKRERNGHREQVASLHTQLNATEDQIGSLQSELQAARGCVAQLESYLGGELPEEGSGVTWRDERSTLLARINASGEDRGRLEKETHLMAIRLSAISEILSLQEAKLMQGKEENGLVEQLRDAGVTKQPGEVEAVRGDVSGVEGGLKGVLSLWREKVFALLVQARLQQMQHSREMHEAQCRMAGLRADVIEVTRERDLLSHTLTDKTAQLQLQISRTEDLESLLQQAELARQDIQTEADRLTSLLQHTVASVRDGVDGSARLKSCVDGCMSRMANYEQRVGVVTRRVASLRAMLSSQLALQGVSGEESTQRSAVHVSTQTEVLEKTQELSQLSHGLLLEEVVSLMRERDSLTDQLSQSSAALQQLRTTVSVTDQTCSTLTVDNSSMRHHLEEITAELDRHREMETELHSTQASLQARIDSAVMKERKKCRQELGEAQSLLEVARREHSKTALQLQQTERKLHREQDCAVEAVEVSKRGVEEELQRCQDKLRAVQVERNLLLTALRQEGIKVPAKRPPPRPLTTQVGATQTHTHTTTHPETQVGATQTNMHTTTHPETQVGATQTHTHTTTHPETQVGATQTNMHTTTHQETQVGATQTNMHTTTHPETQVGATQTNMHTTTHQETSDEGCLGPFLQISPSTPPANLESQMTAEALGSTRTSSECSSHSSSPPPSSRGSRDDEGERQSDGTYEGSCGGRHSEVVQRRETGEVVRRMVPLPQHSRQTAAAVNGDTHENSEEDIQKVLKELQLLSTSLLEMTTQS